MKRFNKLFFTVAVVAALIAVGATTVSACVATFYVPSTAVAAGAPPAASTVGTKVRAEGKAEMLANVLLTCTGAGIDINPSSGAFNPVPTATANSFITVSLAGVNFAPAAASGATANNTSVFPAPTIASTVAMGVKPTVSVSGGSVTFGGMTPGAGAQSITITNLRANIADSGLDQVPITATVSYGGGLVGPTGVGTVATVSRGLSTSSTSGAFVWPGPASTATTSPVQFPSCVPPLPTPGGATPALTARVTDAAFAGAPGNAFLAVNVKGSEPTTTGVGALFKPRLDPTAAGLILDTTTEDAGAPADTTATGQGGGAGADNIYGNADDVLGGALQGTRVLIILTGIPSGITIYAPRQNPPTANGFAAQAGTTTAAAFVRVLAADAADGSGGALGAIVSRQLDKIDVIGGTATIVYEFVGVPSSATQADINLFITGASPVSTGTIKGELELAPIGPPTVSPSRPQFSGGRSVKTVANVAACASYLLFPWVVFTGDGQWDTGLAISNTSADPPGSAPAGIGTPAQKGKVTLNFWRAAGGTNPAPVVIGPSDGLPAGQSATFLASSLKDPFIGYIIAVCDFAFGHGFGFINSPSPGTGGAFAQGYVALSLPNPRGFIAGVTPVFTEVTGQ